MSPQKQAVRHIVMVCRACRMPIELFQDEWGHSDPMRPGRMRFWCPDKAGDLERVEPGPR